MEITFFKAVNPQIKLQTLVTVIQETPFESFGSKKQWKSWLLNNNKVLFFLLRSREVEPHSYICFQLLLPIIAAAAASLKTWTKLNNIFHWKSVNCYWISFLINLFPFFWRKQWRRGITFFSRNGSKTKPLVWIWTYFRLILCSDKSL